MKWPWSQQTVQTAKRLGSWPPKIAVSSWSFHSLFANETMRIMDFPDFCKQKLEVDYVELLVNHLLSDDEKVFKEFLEAANKAGVRVVCLALDNDFTHTGTQLDTEVVRAGKHLKRAQTLGVEIARINPGLREEDAPGLAENIVTGIKRLLPVAQETGIRLALENHFLFGMHAENLLDVLERVNAPEWLGVCLDFGNLYPEDFDIVPARLAPYATHVHAKSYAFKHDGEETTINYLRRFEELHSAGYGGYVSVEWEGDEALDHRENARRTIRLIQECIGQLG